MSRKKKSRTSFSPSLLVLAVLLALPAARAVAQTPPGFAERWALATDRAALLAELLPGSSDWYWYRCRERLDAGDFEAVDALLRDWRPAHADDPRQTIVENRRRLLAADSDREATFNWLQQRLGLRFDAVRVDPSVPIDLPTRLDPALIDRDRLRAQYFTDHPDDLAAFDPDELPWLLEQGVLDTQIDAALTIAAETERFDLPQIPRLVCQRLARGGGWGSHPIHGKLRLQQLDECLRLRPELLQDAKFGAWYLKRLEPPAGVDLVVDRAARAAYLDRLSAFAQRLGPAFSDLKAHVLYHRLQLDRELGAPDKTRFLAYIALPHRTAFSSHNRAEDYVVANDAMPTLLPDVGDPEALVRACLEHFFATEDDTAPYAPWLEAEWLQRTFATTKLLLGQGDAKRWYGVLGADAAAALERRVEIAFAPTMPRVVGARDRLVVEFDTKNVSSLLVRVHALDALRWYREKMAPIPIDLDLDGLVAIDERTIAIAEPPIRRVHHRIELPTCDAPGAFVIECIGKGVRSRMLVQKGKLSLVERLAVDGHRFRIFDETGTPVPDAAMWFGERDFTPGPDGEIVVPFVDKATRRSAVLHQGERADLAVFDHEVASYELAMQCHVDREALIAGAEARLLVRPKLEILGHAVPLTRLRDLRLEITATDLDDVATKTIVRDPEFDADREYVHTFTVPDRLQKLSVALTGQVHDAWKDAKVLAARDRVFAVNGADATAVTCATHLLCRDGGWTLEVRGKNGEPKANREVAVEITVCGFAEPVAVRLRTDDGGRIELGPLPSVRRLVIAPTGEPMRVLPIPRREVAFPSALHGVEGETLRLPWPDGGGALTRSDVAFASATDDLFDRVALRDGFLELRDLPRGDAFLRLPRHGVRIHVRVAHGNRHGDWIVGDRALAAGIRDPLQVGELTIVDGELRVPLLNHTPRTRVHVVATRHVPAFPLWLLADPVHEMPCAPRLLHALAMSTEVAIPAETRYVLDRRTQPKFPGNMLPRPSLLVNRLDLADTEHGGSKYGSRFARGGGAGGRDVNRETIGPIVGHDAREFAALASANVDWLPRPSVTLANLVPDATGIVRVRLADLGDGPWVHVVALDGEQTVTAALVRPEAPLAPRPRTLSTALDPAMPTVEETRIVAVAAGATEALGGAEASFALIDSLPRAQEFFASVCEQDAGGCELPLDWPQLDDAARRDWYRRFACHELNLFLWHKDRAWFDANVRSMLANKRVKTFVDRWLCGDDLRSFADPAAYARLNVCERALLARRLGGAAQAAIVRDLGDAVARAPMTANDRSRRLAAALAVGSLEPSIAPLPPLPPQPRDVDEPPDFDGHRSLVARHYIEHDWWHRRPDQATPDVVAPSRFWLDFARGTDGQPFLSPAIVEIGIAGIDATLALAVTDLPFAAGAHEFAGPRERRTLRAATPLLAVEKDTTPARTDAAAAPLLVGENFFPLDDPVVVVDGEQRERTVTGEFLVGVPYGCRVFASNPTPHKRRVQLLLQVPAGAIPVVKAAATRTVSLELEPFATARLDYAFYFPASGDFAHCPVHATEKGVAVAHAEPRRMQVAATPSRVDTTSWDDVAQRGTAEAVLAFVDAHDARQLDYGQVAWRLRERPFYDALVEHLRDRRVVDDTVWQHAILHRDVVATREYLAGKEAFTRQCGPLLESPLLALDPVARGDYQHIEIDPLIRRRAHSFAGDEPGRDGASRQYDALLDVLGWKRGLSGEDWLAVAYYQFLLDRIGDGLDTFAKVDRSTIAEQVQYDYFAAWVCFFTRDLGKARSLAEPHRDHPFESWRERFREVLAQIDEAEGRSPRVPPPANGSDRQVAASPSLELALAGTDLVLRTANLQQCELRYYPLDVELAFSSRPFAAVDPATAAFVQPAQSETKDVDAGGVSVFAVPERLRQRNLLVEARGGGLLRRLTLIANSLDVRIVEPWGQLLVTEPGNGAPLPRTYVKVFARTAEGAVSFHKDGYTDVRGRLDYASLTEGGDHGARYAILVLHDERGAVIREAAAPAR